MLLPYLKQIKQVGTAENSEKDTLNDSLTAATFKVKLNWKTESTPMTFLGTEATYNSERCRTSALSIYYKLDKCSGSGRSHINSRGDIATKKDAVYDIIKTNANS